MSMPISVCEPFEHGHGIKHCLWLLDLGIIMQTRCYGFFLERPRYVLGSPPQVSTCVATFIWHHLLISVGIGWTCIDCSTGHISFSWRGSRRRNKTKQYAQYLECYFEHLETLTQSRIMLATPYARCPSSYARPRTAWDCLTLTRATRHLLIPKQWRRLIPLLSFAWVSAKGKPDRARKAKATSA